MICAVLQPSYIPWRGYFHIIQKCDVFVFYDDVQYTDSDWRNRNRIKTANGTRWLTIPVHHRGNVVKHRPIHEIAIDHDKPWAQKHLATLLQSYARAPHLDRYRPLLEEIYAKRTPLLADFTIDTTVALARELGLERQFLRSSTMALEGTKTNRLVALLRKLGATHYVSGPSARAYIDEEQFRAAGITLEYMAYGYPEYAQLHPPYDPQVSILDLLLMQGPQSPGFIWASR